MARLGVTYQEVAGAANQLLGQGKSPTIEHIRLLLGTGSSTTIANHLREWRAGQSRVGTIATQEDMPAELIIMIKSLWDKINVLTEDKITAEAAKSTEQISELEQALAKYKANNLRWQKLMVGWSQEKERFQNELSAARELINQISQNNSTLEVKLQEKDNQLVSIQAHVDELKRLLAHTQENHEHDRINLQAQRLKEQKQHVEQNKAQQAIIKSLQDKMNSGERDQINLKNNYKHLEDKFKDLQISSNDTIKHLKSHVALLEEKLATNLDLITNNHIEIKVLKTQLAEQRIIQAKLESQNKELLNDKLHLSVENTKLQTLSTSYAAE